MIGRLKIFLVILLASFGSITLFVPAAMAVNPLGNACNTNAQTRDSPVCKQAREQTKSGEDPIAGPNGILNKAANIVALVGGVGAVIMILIGGFFYITSGGNAERAGKAKSRILSAFIGLVVIALAWAIVRLITDRILR